MDAGLCHAGCNSNALTSEPGQNDTFLMRARTEMQPCGNGWPEPKWCLGFVENVEAVNPQTWEGTFNVMSILYSSIFTFGVTVATAQLLSQFP